MNRKTNPQKAQDDSYLRPVLAGLCVLTILASCAVSRQPADIVIAGENRSESPPDAPESQSEFVPDRELFACRGIRVSNAPKTDMWNRIEAYAPFVHVTADVILAVAPVSGACLTSGYGIRGGRAHAGIDLQSKPAGPIFAAGSGRIVELTSRGEYGNYILIDHGDGVYTRYAHLESFAKDLRVGDRIGFGTEIGMMGNSSTRRIGVHLHYEILMGEYNTARKSFGLTPVNPFELQPAVLRLF